LGVVRHQPIEDRHGASLAHGGEGRVLSCATLPLDRREHDRVLRGDFHPAAALTLNARVIAVSMQHDDERYGFRRSSEGFARDVLVAKRESKTRQVFRHRFIPEAELVVHHVRLEFPGFRVVVRVETLAVRLSLGHVEAVVLAEYCLPGVLERLREGLSVVRQLAHDDALESSVRVRIRVGGERLRVVDLSGGAIRRDVQLGNGTIRRMDVGRDRN
jgi:hypothetical protein